MRWLLVLLAASPAGADTLVAARTIRAQAILTPADVTVTPAAVPGALAHPDEALGMETRVVLYAGRPIRPEDLGPPAIVDRNQTVPLAYRAGPLTIRAEGRALARGGAGDVIRVMNLASRTTVSGVIRPDGSVAVGASR
ncbi:flagellar basal body P-ring formation chaperone FlgA [Ruixingdingia sedimenti]